MNVLMAIAAICLSPQGGVLSDRADVTEINHVFDEEGERRFTQTIWWDWDRCGCRYQVVDWRWTEKVGRPEWDGRQWATIWAHDERIHRVVSPLIRETWTQHDVEVHERTILPPNQRRKLFR